MTLLQPDNDAIDLIGYFIGALIPGCLVAASGVAFARFLLRARPPAIAEDRRDRLSGAVAFYLAFIGLYFIFVFLMRRLVSPPDTENVVGTLLAAMLWSTSAIALVIRRQRRPRRFLEVPFVLFLRRFSSFPDRAVIAVILRQASHRVPVVFLTPTLSRPRDWDPYLVGLAGLKLLHPWRSAPIVIRARDDAWEEAADELIRQAQTILLDTSDTSGAVRAEAEMIDRAGRWSDTVCLKHVVSDANPGKGSLGGSSDVRTIEYTKSWLRALPRMVVGLPIVLILAIVLAASIPPIGLLKVVALIIIAALAVAFYWSAFVLPTINREARSALKTVLRTGAATPRQAVPAAP
jgi:hypothetical protein